MSDALLIKLLSEIQRWLISLYPFSEMEIRPLVYATGLLHSALFSAALSFTKNSFVIDEVAISTPPLHILCATCQINAQTVFLHLYYMLLLQFCQLSYCLINQYIICRKTHDNSPTYIPKMTEIVARKRTP